MDYQRISLADGTVISVGPLPANLVGLADESLANLNWTDGFLGYQGQGFIPLLRKVTAIGFKQRMTPQERIAIRAAAATDPVVFDFLDLLNTPGQGIIELDHADTVNALGYLASQGLLTDERVAEIRA